jgi:hypothetical protein
MLGFVSKSAKRKVTEDLFDAPEAKRAKVDNKSTYFSPKSNVWSRKWCCH